MAVRQFDGVDDDVQHAVGGLSAMTHGTFAALVKVQAPTGEFGSILALLTSDSTLRAQWYYNEGVEGHNIFVVFPPETTTVDLLNYENQWALLVARKASGSVPVTFSLYRFNQGQWSHGNSSNFANWTSPGANGIVARSLDGDEHFRGLIAVQAVWANRVPFANNTAVQNAGLHQSLDAWFDAEPDALWAFNQESVTDPVNDLTGNGADQIARTGTAVIIGDDPPGFDWGDEEEVPELTATLAVELNLAGDAATPPATIPEVSAALGVAVDLAGAAEAPAATVPEIMSSLAIDVDLAGAAEAPSAEVPELTASLNLAVDLAGDVAAPPATVLEITSSLAIGVDLAGAAETPPDIPELEASLRIDLALDGELDVPPATVPELAGALAVEVAASGVLEPPPAVEVPELAATLNLAVDLTGAAESPAVTVPEATASLTIEVDLAGTAVQPPNTATGTLTLELGLSGTLDQPTATVPQVSGTLGLEIGLSGFVSHSLPLAADVVPGAYRPTTVAATHQPSQIPGRV